MIPRILQGNEDSGNHSPIRNFSKLFQIPYLASKLLCYTNSPVFLYLSQMELTQTKTGPEERVFRRQTQKTLSEQTTEQPRAASVL